MERISESIKSPNLTKQKASAESKANRRNPHSHLKHQSLAEVKCTSGKLPRSSHSERLSLQYHQMRFCVTQTVSILSGSAGVKDERDAIVQWCAWADGSTREPPWRKFQNLTSIHYLSTQLDTFFPVAATILKLLISLDSYTILTTESKHNFMLTTVWSTLLSTKLRSHDSNLFILVYTASVTSLVFWSIYTGFPFDCIAGKSFSSLLSLFVSLGSINHERLAQHPGEDILMTQHLDTFPPRCMNRSWKV